MSIKDYLHTQVDFVNFDLSDEKQTGFVVEVEESDPSEGIDAVLVVRVEYGPHHGQLVRVFESEIFSSMYDEYECSDEKMYSWYDGE